MALIDKEAGSREFPTAFEDITPERRKCCGWCEKFSRFALTGLAISVKIPGKGGSRVLVLAIETSCDETSAAVLRAPSSGVPSSPTSSATSSCPGRDHAPYGGVVPELASRQHIKTITAVVGEALERAATGLEAIDLYAVTQGPGLVGSLLVGSPLPKAWPITIRSRSSV